MGDVRRVLEDPNPLSMLSFVSTLLCITDSRQRIPFGEPADSRPAGPSRENLVGMFLDVPTPETSALLAVVAELAGDDDLLPVRIRRELAARPDIEPTWLTQLSRAQTYRAVRMSHILGDGDNVMLGTRLPGGDEFTCIVYIDHNLGTLVKDAFFIPEPIENIVAGYHAVTDDPDTRWEDIPLADARIHRCRDRTCGNHVAPVRVRQLARLSRTGRVDHPRTASGRSRTSTATVGCRGTGRTRGSVLRVAAGRVPGRP